MTKKIMFNDKYGLTEAVLSGRKTMTRRIAYDFRKHASKKVGKCVLLSNNNLTYKDGEVQVLDELRSPQYQVGEIVAVSQSYNDAGFSKGYYCDEDTLIPIFVGADTENDISVSPAGWNNKMFVKAELMPHKIQITNVRIERLQDISDEDCIKEGIGISSTDNRIGYPLAVPFNYFVGEDKKGCRYTTPREAYSVLIDRISGKGTWDKNPFVFVYDFELVK